MPDIRAIADDLLDLTVVPSYTDLGLRIRRRMFDWQDLDAMRMDGRVVLITGASSGLGLVAASQLARMGAGLRLVVRDPTKGVLAIDQIRERAPGSDARVYEADLSDLRAVRGLVERILGSEERLDVLVNNAGALLPERQTSVDGYEMTFATMVLGPFVLTNGLAPLLERTAAGAGRTRVINVASGGMYLQGLHLDDLEMERERYHGSVAYSRAKRAQVVLTGLWARRWRDLGIVVHAMHPGWADTPGLEEGLPRFRRLIRARLRTPEEGADTIVWLAASDEAVRSTGRFWLDRRPRPTETIPGTAVDADQARRLWEACERLTEPPEANRS